MRHPGRAWSLGHGDRPGRPPDPGLDTVETVVVMQPHSLARVRASLSRFVDEGEATHERVTFTAKGDRRRC